MQKLIFDIELFPNYLLIGLKDYKTGEIITFQVSDYMDERQEAKEFFNNYKGFLVGFNSIHYDEPVLGFLLRNNTKNRVMFLKEIKQFSDSLINDEQVQNKYFKKSWITIDLFNFWSLMLRKAKKISLKSLGIQMGYPVVQELPYSPAEYLNEEQIRNVYTYNTVHDLNITLMLAKKLKNDILIRKELNELYRIYAWSYSPTKIASEILLKEFCRVTGKNPTEVKEARYKSKSYTIGDNLPQVNYKTEFFKELYKEVQLGSSEFSKTFVYPVKSKHIKVSMGVGGIHTMQKNESYFSNDEYTILDSDIASMYPATLYNYRMIRPELYSVLDIYNDIKDKRIAAKKANEMIKSDAYKLILNSTTGLMDNKNMWLYSPAEILALRVFGQMVLLRVVEELSNQIIFSTNTDGITMLCKRSELASIKQTIDEIGREYKFDFEHAEYKWIRYMNVNNYIALDANGKVKKKGLFRTDIPLGDSTNFLVVPKTLELHYIKGISPEEILNNPSQYGLHIYDFCESKKVSSQFTVYHNGEKQQRLNRYFASKSGAYLYKNKSHMLKESPVIILNQYNGESVDTYPINKSFYLKKIHKIISSLAIQPSLFK